MKYIYHKTQYATGRYVYQEVKNIDPHDQEVQGEITNEKKALNALKKKVDPRKMLPAESTITIGAGVGLHPDNKSAKGGEANIGWNQKDTQSTWGVDAGFSYHKSPHQKATNDVIFNSIKDAPWKVVSTDVMIKHLKKISPYGTDLRVGAFANVKGFWTTPDGFVPIIQVGGIMEKDTRYNDFTLKAGPVWQGAFNNDLARHITEQMEVERLERTIVDVETVLEDYDGKINTSSLQNRIYVTKYIAKQPKLAFQASAYNKRDMGDYALSILVDYKAFAKGQLDTRVESTFPVDEHVIKRVGYRNEQGDIKWLSSDINDPAGTTKISMQQIKVEGAVHIPLIDNQVTQLTLVAKGGMTMSGLFEGADISGLHRHLAPSGSIGLVMTNKHKTKNNRKKRKRKGKAPHTPRSIH